MCAAHAGLSAHLKTLFILPVLILTAAVVPSFVHVCCMNNASHAGPKLYVNTEIGDAEFGYFVGFAEFQSRPYETKSFKLAKTSRGRNFLIRRPVDFAC